MHGHRWNPYLRFPGGSLLATLIVAGILIASGSGVRLNSKMEVLLEGDQRNKESYQRVRDILANTDMVMVSLELPDLFTPQGIDTVRRVSTALMGVDNIIDVKSLTHSVRPVRRGLTFRMVPLVPEGVLTPEVLEELRAFAVEHPLMRNLMVSGDGRHTIILVTYQDRLETDADRVAFREGLDRIMAPFREEGLQAHVLALPLVEEEILQTLRGDLVLITPTAAALLVVILWVAFRSWRYLVLVLLNQGLVLALILGLVMHAANLASIFSGMLLPLFIGIHLTLLAHVHASYQRMRRAGKEGSDAIEGMLREVGRSCLFASITTMAGLGSLLLSDVQTVQEFGWLGMVGVALIFLMTFGPGMALLSLSGRFLPVRQSHDGARQDGDQGPTWVRWLMGVLKLHRAKVVALTVLLLIPMVMGLMRLRTDIRAVEFLSRESPTRQSLEAMDRVYGGINVVRVEFDSGQTNGIQDAVFLDYLYQVQQEVEALPDVSGVYSYAQLLAMMNQIWEGGANEALQVPRNAFVRNLFVMALQTSGFPFLTALSDTPQRTAYLILRTRDMPAEQYLGILEKTMELAQRDKPESVTVSASQGIHTILEADRRIVRSQVTTGGMTFVVIALVLTLLWRSPVLALVSLVTNAIPIALVLAMAGLAGIPLNAITVMVAAIALGISVDDSVHFITHWRQVRMGQGNEGQDPLARTLQVKGRPIIATSAALIAIFSLFLLSSFPPVAHFGLLCAVAFAGALGSTLVFLPAVLGWMRKEDPLAGTQGRRETQRSS